MTTLSKKFRSVFAQRVFTSAAFLALSSTAVSCVDPRVFDDIEDETWVNTHDTPENISDYAIGMVAGGGADLNVGIAAGNPPALIRVRFDKSGTRDSQVTEVRTVLTSAENLSNPAMASDTTQAGFDGDSGNMALAVLNGDSSTLFMMRAKDGVATAPISLDQGGAPATGIAFGDTDVSDGTIDLVAASGEQLHLVESYQGNTNTVSCTLGGTTGGVLLVDVGSSPSAEVLVALDGDIQVLQASNIGSVSGGNCLTDLVNPVPPPESIPNPGDASFGAKILAGDFDSNDEADLVVTAPEENGVYVYMNWRLGDNATPLRLPQPSGSGRFGHDIAIGDFNGDGRDELVVSDPEAGIAAHDNAGRTYIYTTDNGGTIENAPILLHDSRAEDDQVFGQSVAVDSGSLFVGANAEVFTYFQTPVNGDEDFRDEP